MPAGSGSRRWKQNASRKRKPPIQRQLGGGGSGMPAGSGSHPSSASSGAVEAECQHEAEADDFDGYTDEDGTEWPFWWHECVQSACIL